MVQQLADILFYIFILFFIVTPLILAYRLVNRDNSPSVPSIPATRLHSPEPEAGPSKRPITWDLKDSMHPLHRWGMQQAYKEHIEQARYNYPVPCLPSDKSGLQLASPTSPQQASPHQSTSPRSETTGLRSPGLESIPEEDTEEAAPLGGHHQPPTMPGGIHQDP